MFIVIKIKYMNLGRISDKVNFTTKLHTFYNTWQTFYQNIHKYYNFWHIWRDGLVAGPKNFSEVYKWSDINELKLTLISNQLRLLHAISNSDLMHIWCQFKAYML